MTATVSEFIRLKGIRQNNLKGFDLDLPLGKLIVVTGLSGAGKSSLVFDTLHAEGQRRYVETFSPYTRQFLELLDRPQLDSVDQIRPSIAIQQSNTVKTSRSTVGTMTELTDFFKVWFCHVAELFDPETGERIDDDHPESILAKAFDSWPGQRAILAFPIARPKNITWEEICQNLIGQGYARIYQNGKLHQLDSLKPQQLKRGPISVVQDRLKLDDANRARFIEAARTALHYGHGILQLLDPDGQELGRFSAGLHHPVTGKTFKAATPALFSFNSPIGACPECRGFGRTITVDYRLAIPNRNITIEQGLVKAWQGEVYSESLRDLIHSCNRAGIPTNVPFCDLPQDEQDFVIYGDPDYGKKGKRWPDAWYGVKGFFDYLESKTYRMHVRVFLSRYRSYVECPSCHGSRLQPDALNWKWENLRLPDLYKMPVEELLPLVRDHFKPSGDRQVDLAYEAILTRLNYLDQVGLGYLTMDRSSRSLSGGEVERVNLTTCLGTSLVDTLFVLDEPSIGLHSRDIDRLIRILRRLTDMGNTVVVVEHDEAIMRAADQLIEIGPQPGKNGGELVFQGSLLDILEDENSLTGQYLSHRKEITVPEKRRRVIRSGKNATPKLSLKDVSQHNIVRQDFDIPLQRLVALTGVSGSGKSTLLDNVLYQALLEARGLSVEHPASISSWSSDIDFEEVVLIDQGPVTKTPRSNPVLYVKAWDEIRKLFAKTDAALSQGFTAAFFSFNSGDGRCDNCQGLGYEQVEMQFLSDVYVPCPICETKRFKPEILAILWNGKSVSDILAMTVSEALLFFQDQPRIAHRLQALDDVGLGYLGLGQPLNTLSGGESQRLKLVKYLSQIDLPHSRSASIAAREGEGASLDSPKKASKKPATPSDSWILYSDSSSSSSSLLLLDEPTTGLHKHDVKRLIGVLHRLVDAGHSVILIEHNLDLIKSCDWLIELGPEAGSAGGRLVAQGTPEKIAKADTPSAPFLRDALNPENSEARSQPPEYPLLAAEPPATYGKKGRAERPRSASDAARAGESFVSSEALAKRDSLDLATEAPQAHLTHSQFSLLTPHSSSSSKNLEILGAREHNLKNISLAIPGNQLTVVTGVSGSGKSSLAFDIVFAEGQRRFLESMSAYARQFVEQLPRPDIDDLRGIAPTVAIEQRVTRGSRKSTVATITEVAQYLRLLYARIGIQHTPDTHLPVVSLSPSALLQRLEKLLKDKGLKKQKHIYLCAPLIRSRKGHHEPVAKWIAKHGHELMRVDGKVIPVSKFKKLSRYKEHDIEVVIADLGTSPQVGASLPACPSNTQDLDSLLKDALRIGKKSCFLALPDGTIQSWLSTERVDPVTGEAFPELDPKHFSWNSSKGWCPDCKGNGAQWVENEDEEVDRKWTSEVCPSCNGTRLNPLSRNVYLNFKHGKPLSLPELLQCAPKQLLDRLADLDLDARGKAIVTDIQPQIEERLKFMDEVGLNYLGLDRATATLSGGEAQRIRLAAQLGSNLSGVLYVLDEPSIGLHARDNERLIESLQKLKSRGNTLLVVEHDDETMEAADHIIDLGPGAGIHGGEILAQGSYEKIIQAEQSLTGRYLKNGIPHPIRGSYRDLPEPFNPRKRKEQPWLVLQNTALRNLKGDDLHIPLARLVMVGGISGAGKSTLIRDLLHPVVDHARRNGIQKLDAKDFLTEHSLPNTHDGQPFKRLINGDRFRHVIEVDQSPIGKTPRSTPATYMGAMDIIRQFFASLPEAKMRGMDAGTFSFNTKGGRCETCKGSGTIKLEMNFLPNAYMTCEDCGGSRYGHELDDIRWKDKTIADILKMSFEEAAEFFSFHSQLGDMLGLMVETGLGYLELGQSSPTLSGGEAQRLKLVSELAKGLPSFRDKSRAIKFNNLYILEEPTIGLHLSDCERLIHLLHRLVDQGHTVVVIEHNLDLLAEADWLIEVGPEGGEAGGQILYQGPASGLKKVKGSPTRPFLTKKLTGK